MWERRPSSKPALLPGLWLALSLLIPAAVSIFIKHNKEPQNSKTKQNKHIPYSQHPNSSYVENYISQRSLLMFSIWNLLLPSLKSPVAAGNMARVEASLNVIRKHLGGIGRWCVNQFLHIQLGLEGWVIPNTHPLPQLHRRPIHVACWVLNWVSDWFPQWGHGLHESTVVLSQPKGELFSIPDVSVAH